MVARIRYCKILKKECGTGVCIYSKDSLCDYPFAGKKKHPLEAMLEPVQLSAKIVQLKKGEGN
jgi:hypothetical protein